MDEKISVIMSVFNETEDVLNQSINSILSQSYPNFEFIIINDNPENALIGKVLSNIEDARVRIITNSENIGLVNSLNRGLEKASGKYIARMDADDISEYCRLETQLKYLKLNNLDLVGSSIKYINQNGTKQEGCGEYPTDMKQILRKNRWRQCVAHPTFFAKKEVYDVLNGYRHIDYCEDYDFICRCIYCNFKIGNVSQPLLNYRLRMDGISSMNMYEQKVRSNYIGALKKDIIYISEEQINDYFLSDKYQYELKLCESYFEGKVLLREGKLLSGCKKVLNKYLFYAIMRHLY